MYNSANRMNFIIDYISAYEQKIKLANNNGLFDNAKLFEVFAIEICALWFNQEFTNLNDEKLNYPYLDLVSKDKKLFVQVTTNQDLPTKIKYTLNKIKDSDSEVYSSISNVIFFVLSNDSVNKLKDYKGKDRIGKIEFIVKNNLITTNDIINRAASNADFQEKLYLLLKKDFDNFESNSKDLSKALELSKIGIVNIDSKINNEYEINRQDLIKQIVEDDEKFITVQGEPGSGKSVLCKKLVEDKEIVIYARAERFLKESDINQIWNFEIIQTLDYLNDKEIIFFIDALEFIADSNKSQLNLLDYFYHICSQYDNVKVITSCRTTDKSAFIHIEAKYSIKTYESPLLTKEEIEEISKKYSIIKQVKGIDQYSQLIASPFYVNLIVSNVSDIDNIKDVNAFRNYIWTEIICIKEKVKRYNLIYNEIVGVVNYLVMERAKSFLVGIQSEKINTNILEALKSEGVIIENSGTVRLKYDIFEDICFENHFDIQFDECKGDYNSFFNSIGALGRCIYRRYQIWVSNKILTKPNREKFLYLLLFSQNIPEKWRIQSEIGLVKSNYSQSFFDEYIDCIIESDLIFEFIQTINLYAFNTKIINLPNDISELLLEPCGVGRSKLICYIWKKELYKNDDLKQYIIKLCNDFSNQKQTYVEDKEYSCSILEYYVDELFNEESQNHIYNIDKNICELLMPIYRMSDVAKEWIDQLFTNLIAGAKGDNQLFSGVCEKIIDFTLKNTPPQLIANISEYICNLAESYWTYSTEKKYQFRTHYDKYDKYYIYGLNDNAKNYEYYRRTVNDCAFLFWLFKTNVFYGLKWSVKFLNNLMLNYNKHLNDDVIEIAFVKNKDKKIYIGNEAHWLVGVVEHQLPMVIGDIVYLLKKELLGYGEYLLSETNKENFISVFLDIRNYIYKESNNVLLLSIISAIGMHFNQKLPGYSLDLATNIDVLFWDLHRYVELQYDPIRKKIEQSILLSVGLPDLKHRYGHQFNKEKTLKNYVFDLQLYGNDHIKQYCFQILDFLYSTTSNDNESAKYYLQIQNMDSRLAEFKKIDESIYSVETKPTGAAAEIVHNNENKNKLQREIDIFIRDNIEKMTSNDFTIKDTFTAISRIKSYTNNSKTHLPLEEHIVISIIYALKQFELSTEQRSELCDIWICGINGMFEGKNFEFQHPAVKVLFEQLNKGISFITRNNLKSLLLKLIIGCGQNGLLLNLSQFAKEYLFSDKKIATCIFYTILMLSAGEKQEINRQEIITNYLFNEETLDIHSVDLNSTKIDTMCYVANCGLDLCDRDFFYVIKFQLVRMIDYWVSEDYSWRDLSVYVTSELQNLFMNEIIRNPQIAYNCLFDDIDFSKFKSEAIEFYHMVFAKLITEFFDSHSDTEKRRNCKNSIRILEKKVNNITVDKIKREFYKSICLSPTYNMGDWSKCGVGYSYTDKSFINELLCKYGKYNIESTLYTVYQLRVNYLMPEILISLNSCFKDIKNNGLESISDLINSSAKSIIDQIIITAFLNYNDQIKRDFELCQSYEGLLEALVVGQYEKAAVLLDEFRIH